MRSTHDFFYVRMHLFVIFDPQYLVFEKRLTSFLLHLSFSAQIKQYSHHIRQFSHFLQLLHFLRTCHILYCIILHVVIKYLMFVAGAMLGCFIRPKQAPIIDQEVLS